MGIRKVESKNAKHFFYTPMGRYPLPILGVLARVNLYFPNRRFGGAKANRICICIFRTGGSGERKRTVFVFLPPL